MRSLLLAIVAIFLVAHSSLVAADKTWTGGGGVGVPSWSAGVNWGAVAPVANDALIFPILTPSSLNKTASNDFVAGTAFGPITINSSGYVISGFQVDLNGGLFLNGANAAQVVLPLELANPLAFSVSNANGILTLTQPISGTGGIIKSGNGLLILNGSHTYSGPTIITGGALQVGGSLPPGAIQMTNGFITGTGNVDGITSLNQGIAAISPGTSSATGTLTSNDDVTLFSNDQVWFDITSTGSDKLVVNGAVRMPIEANGFFLALQSTYVPLVNTTFVLIENDGTDPVVFDAVTPSNYLIPTFLLNGQRFQISFVGGVGRNDVVLRKVGPSDSTVTLTTLASSVIHGNSVTFTATVTGAMVIGFPVSFWDGNEYLGSSNIVGNLALFTTTTLKPSSVLYPRQITAMFEGNNTYAPVRSAILPQTVTGTATTIGLALVPTPSSAPNVLVTMTATVFGGSPSGTVTFFDGGVELATIAAATNPVVHTTTTLLSGAHSISATYNPTGALLSSPSNTVTHTVTGSTTTTVLTVLPASTAVAGTDVTFTATVTGGTPTGSVVFRDGTINLGTVPLSGTSAALTTSGLPSGTHSITASYLGSTEEQPSTSNTVSQVITAAPDGSGSTGGGGDVELQGGCGLGSGVAALILGLLMLVGLRLRRH